MSGNQLYASNRSDKTMGVAAGLDRALRHHPAHGKPHVWFARTLRITKASMALAVGGQASAKVPSLRATRRRANWSRMRAQIRLRGLSLCSFITCFAYLHSVSLYDGICSVEG